MDARALVQHHGKDVSEAPAPRREPPAWADRLALGLRRRVPVILQTEAAECGLACLAMVLGFYGVATDLSVLRSRHAISLKGTTLATLAQLAQDEKLGFRAVRLELDELHGLRMPAILHWDLNHYVVLVAVDGNRATIHDPDRGRCRISLAELGRHFTGVALELWPDPGFAPRNEASVVSLRQLIGQVTGLWPALARVMTLSLVLELFALLSPLFLQWVIDHVVVSRDITLLTTLALGFLLLLLLQQGIGLLRSWLLLAIGTSVRVQWRANIFGHLLRLPLGWFHKRHLGDIVSRTGAIDNIQRVLTSALVESLLDGVMMLLTLVMMFVYSPLLAWIALVSVAIYLTLRLVWYMPVYHATQDQIVRSAVQSTHFLETIRGIRTIKLFGRQLERRNAWQALMVSETNAGLAVQKLRIFYSLARSLLSGGSYIALLWVGALQVVGGNLSVGMLLAFLAYRGMFDSRMAALIDQAIELRMLRLHGERLGDVVLTPAEPGGRTLGEDAAQRPPEIALEGLRFRYADHEPWILDGLSARIASGESVALVGPSGCGKSTLVQVLLGVLAPQEGNLRIGGTLLDPRASAAWRQMVGTVMQDDTLFAGSIAENITFFDPKPDPAWIAECARLAAVDRDIEAMPMGYQTLVGDMGTVLSGGQKQRVMLARALYKRPRVLILDEATSHLDLRREAQISTQLAGLAMTRLIITHRPESLTAVQRVIEMDQGRIVFDGTPADYLARIGLVRATPEPA
jgi:ATP-binding cassette subfamily B protein RaxB